MMLCVHFTAVLGSWVDNAFSTSSSGKLFRAERGRTYPGALRFRFAAQLQQPLQTAEEQLLHFPLLQGRRCQQWAVTTTIFSPSRAVNQVDGLHGWCLVVIGDRKTPMPYTINGTFLSSADQVCASPPCPETLNLLRWSHFGRKNLGYLYAIANGAHAIFDFDDDNELKSEGPGAIPVPSATSFVEEPNTSHKLYNLYAQLSNRSSAWPRGFPLDQVLEPATRTSSFVARGRSARSISVVQSFADNDPDVDGIFRLTQPLPFSFPIDETVQATIGADGSRGGGGGGGKHGPRIVAGLKEGGRLFAMPLGTMMPFNAQATLWMDSLFWAMLLPCTVHGRVTDIWRAYFAQRLLWDMGERLAFAPPWVTQYRNGHNLLGDFNSELPLYQQSGALVDALLAWRPEARTVPGRLEELYVFMYEIGIVELDDVALVQAWIADLLHIGYKFPEVRQGGWAVGRKIAHDETVTDGVRAPPPPPPLPPPHPRRPGVHEPRHSKSDVSDEGDSGYAHGRTAVCMTGQPRSLTLAFPDEIDITGKYQAFNDRTRKLVFDANLTWTGPPPEGLVYAKAGVARSIRHNVLDVLSANGGYDLFIIAPGARPVADVWSSLRPAPTAAAADVADRMFVLAGGEEPDLWHNASDVRWQNFYPVKIADRAKKNASDKERLIQQVLWQLRHMELCNGIVREYAAATGTTYSFKMRIRPDYAWAAPIPPLQSLAYKNPNHDERIFIGSKQCQWGGNLDSFGVGRARVMDAYFDRAPTIHTDVYGVQPCCQFAAQQMYHKCCLWTAESHVRMHMEQQHVQLDYTDHFCPFLVRPREFQKVRETQTGQ